MRELRRVSGLIFGRSPRPEDPENPQILQDAPTPASQSSSRFGALQNNVRSMVNGSSIYSESPVPSNNNTPKIPFLGFLGRRSPAPPAPIVIPDNEPPRGSHDSRSPLRPQHTAGSYMRTIAPFPRTPQEPQPAFQPQDHVHRHPADVPLRHPADVQLGHVEGVDPETAMLQNEIHNHRRRRRRRHHRRPKPNSHQRSGRPTHWVRRAQRDRRAFCCGFITTQAARAKALSCILSGTFLLIVLAIYLALALTNRSLGQEIHILFIMVVLATTIFFCHSLIRMIMLILRPPPEAPSIPSMMGGEEGFRPIRPIRVHLARDEEYTDHDPNTTNRDNTPSDDANADTDDNSDNDLEKEKPLQPPPPAYGLWRSSVRVDPNLLHWRRVETPPASATHPPPSSSIAMFPNRASQIPPLSLPTSPLYPVASSQQPSPTSPSHHQRHGSRGQRRQDPRPPSYASEDGVSYVVEAAPRSTAPASSGVSDIHPAWRPGGYAISEIRPNEFPAAVGVAAGRGGRI
ncbi:hypothetical protein BU24DRAFT_153240 [Aaosphaeria arxii CBS 175.79]|uniref:Uncharacterized protein n=1 Tax=Aaosphaeria arxii CBS 175.79 TaxID=1450172 RepID=A0A6A5XX87_9PLEO|nr:uncharacterized protein BU24DRAFT_153240 [Aaosphaeria arxii CBS 175.79]KAF2017579.1 hypothetical protein BU24DRAFT_153240 [Aaosphaeria arxii CBS 175.79]